MAVCTAPHRTARLSLQMSVVLFVSGTRGYTHADSLCACPCTCLEHTCPYVCLDTCSHASKIHIGTPIQTGRPYTCPHTRLHACLHATPMQKMPASGAAEKAEAAEAERGPSFFLPLPLPPSGHLSGRADGRTPRDGRRPLGGWSSETLTRRSTDAAVGASKLNGRGGRGV